MQSICETQNCTGCAACMNICPTGCITMAEDVIGHPFPRIEAAKCVDCKKCAKVCPGNSLPGLHEASRAFAVWSLDEKEHSSSSSGGMAAVLTRETLEAGGVVYGCSSRFTGEGIGHARIDRSEEAWLLCGSKYLQSHIGDSYKRAQADLKAGRKVLFIGTPCQIAGLRAFLGRAYENLLVVDLICHGVPPQKLLFDDIGLQPDQLEGGYISFRGPEGFYFKILSSEKQPLYAAQEWDDLFYIGFGKALFFRQSCYSCPYARAERPGDLTLGDFWGLGEKIPFAHRTENGVSVVLLNTKAGEAAFASIRDKLFFEERTVEEAVAGNWNLQHPSLPHEKTERFRALYPAAGFQKAAKSCLKKNIRKYRLLKQIQKCPAALRLVSRLKALRRGG